MLKKLASCIGEYKKQTALTPLTVALESIMETIIPLVMAMLLDNGISAGNMNQLLKYGLILLACAMLSLFFGALSGKYASEASTGFAKNLREKIYYDIQEFSFSNIDKFSTSGLVTRLTTDVTNVQNSFQMIIRICVRAPLMLIFSFVMSFSINAKLAMAFLAVAPIMLAALMYITKKVHPVFEKTFHVYDELNGVVQEDLRGIRVVKSYVREDREIKKFNTVSERLYSYFVKAEKMLAFNNPILRLCMYACIIFISWFGANYIVGGTMTTGQLSSMLQYSIQILMSLNMISMIFVMVTMSRASAERIVEVFNEESEIRNNDKPLDNVRDGSIKFENVSFSYRGKDGKMCLKNINLDIKSGETIGIIGGTGSGKSSLVQLIPRLYDSTEGRVVVGGVDVKDYDIEELRNKVAMVLQKNVLFSGTIKDNLRWGNKYATDEQIKHVCQQASADDFIEQFPDGYDTMIDQGGTNVSGGQKQRICIARALLKNPCVLILDDSTSAVDTGTEARIREALGKDAPGVTKIIIAQRISSVQDADKIIVMDDGMINGIGTHDDLIITNDIYREVYESQQKGGDEDDVA